MSSVLRCERGGPGRAGRRRWRLAGGFTLVETLIAVAVGLLVLGLAVGLLWLASTSFSRAGERAGPREAAHMALTSLGTALRDAWQYRIAEGGRRIDFFTPQLGGAAYLDEKAGELVLEAPGAAGRKEILARSVKSFEVRSMRPGGLKLTLVLERAPAGGKLRDLGALKVVQELFLPAIGLRDPRVPWNRVLEHPKALEPSG